MVDTEEAAKIEEKIALVEGEADRDLLRDVYRRLRRVEGYLESAISLYYDRYISGETHEIPINEVI